MMNNLIKRISALLAAMILLFALPAKANNASEIDWDSLFDSVNTQQHEADISDESATAGTSIHASDEADERSRIRDDADLFSPTDETIIASRITLFQQNTGMDFVVMTSDKAHPGLNAGQLADDYYDYGGFGLDSENSGVAYFIDMAERYHYISTTGHMIDVMTDRRIDTAISANTSYLSSGQYTDAIINMIDMVEDYCVAGVPEGQYQYDVQSGEILAPSNESTLSPREWTLSGIIFILSSLLILK